MRKMGLPEIKNDRHFTYGDYRLWPEDERWELIDGVAWNMCAAPNRAHQAVSGELYRQIANWLKGKPCRVYDAPFDVLLPAWAGQLDDEVDTVVQPDIVVYCDRSKLTDAGATGAPDWAVEIISPWTSRKDLNEKYRLYERVGVREYWVLDPAAKSLQVYRLGEHGAEATTPASPKHFGTPQIFVGGGTAASAVLEGFRINLVELFAED
jgi:Uma2 family endonuclease